jgi:hypothetical protein
MAAAAFLAGAAPLAPLERRIEPATFGIHRSDGGKHGGQPRPRAFKGSKAARRALRGGNQAKASKPRPVRHQLHHPTKTCRRCGLGASQIVARRLEWCQGR